jgi:hypothetical protein
MASRNDGSQVGRKIPGEDWVVIGVMFWFPPDQRERQWLGVARGEYERTLLSDRKQERK